MCNNIATKIVDEYIRKYTNRANRENLNVEYKISRTIIKLENTEILRKSFQFEFMNGKSTIEATNINQSMRKVYSEQY